MIRRSKVSNHSIPSSSLGAALAIVFLLVGFGIAGESLAQSFPATPAFQADEALSTENPRCGTPSQAVREALYPSFEGVPSDCSSGSTNPTAAYDPSVVYQIPVVVHVLMNDACSTGVISDEKVASQIRILNEDFQAIFGTNGGPGNFAGIEFVLADTDPKGSPTTGITRNCNSTWFNDGGSYFNTLAWDPNRYMNIYTNSASGALGYVPFLPADGGGSLVGGNSDRVVILWSTFGEDGPFGPPYNLGRTGTHEVGHYLGLEHTFSGGCADATMPGCYTSGDLICDTNSEAFPSGSPCMLGDKVTCGTVDPSDNYMDYSDDECMNKFTIEQVRRMRCSLQSYRPNLFTIASSAEIFDDDFESGNIDSWTGTP